MGARWNNCWRNVEWRWCTSIGVGAREGIAPGRRGNEGVCCPGFLEKPGQIDELEEARVKKASQG
jgi:hypothetical protein